MVMLLKKNGIVAGLCLKRILVDLGMSAVEEMLWVYHGPDKIHSFPRYTLI